MSYPNGAKFTPPLASTLPAFLPETNGPEFGLAKYRNVLVQGVTVYGLSDGTFAQDYPTAENSNTSYPPYPLMPDQGPDYPNVIATSYSVVPSSQIGTNGNIITRPIEEEATNGLQLCEVLYLIDPYITAVYEGGHTIVVSSEVATALADFTTYGTGYAGNLTAL